MNKRVWSLVASVVVLGAIVTAVVASTPRVAQAQPRLNSNGEPGFVNVRQCVTLYCEILDQLKDGAQVSVRCAVTGQNPYTAAPSGWRWYLVTVQSGKHTGRSGYVSADLVRDAPTSIPNCTDNAEQSFPLIVPEPNGRNLVLMRGQPSPENGYWYSISVTGANPNTTYLAVCHDEEDDVPWGDGILRNKNDAGGFVRTELRTDGSGRAASQNLCYSSITGRHLVGLWVPHTWEEWDSAGKKIDLHGWMHVEFSNEVFWARGGTAGGEPPPQPGTGRIELSQGNAAPSGFWYSMALSGFTPGASVTVTCRDSADLGGFWNQTFTISKDGSASDTTLCYSADGPDHWITGNGVESNHVTWNTGTSPPQPPPANPQITLSQGGPAPSGYWYSVVLSSFTPGATVTVTCRDSMDPGGFWNQTFTINKVGQAADSTLCYSADGPDHWITGGGHESNHITWGGGAPPPPPPPPPPGNPQIALSRGASAPSGYWYSVVLSGFTPGAGVTVTCRDSISPGGFWNQTFTVAGDGRASDSTLCYSSDGPDHWITGGGHESNHITWGGGAPPPPPPPPGNPKIDLSQGGAAPSGYWYSVVLSGFSPGSSVTVTCRDSADPGGFWNQSFTIAGDGRASDSTLCYSADGPDHWVTGGGVESNHLTWGGAPPPPPPPPPPAPRIELSRGGSAPAGYWYSVVLSGFSPGSSVTVTCRDSVDPGGFWNQTFSIGSDGRASDSTLCYSADHPDHWITGGGVESNHVTW